MAGEGERTVHAADRAATADEIASEAPASAEAPTADPFDERDAAASVATASGTVRAPPDEEREDGLLWRLLAGVGGLALAGAVAAIVAPPGAVAGLDRATVELLRSVAMALAGLAGLVGLVAAYHRDAASGSADDPDPAATPIELPVLPETADLRNERIAGARLDEAIEAIGGRVDTRSAEAYSAARVRASLRGLAARVIASAEDCSLEAARERVESGTWTTDRRAAAFLGDDSVPDRPVAMRLRDWASGESFRRQVDATVDELADRMGVDEP